MDDRRIALGSAIKSLGDNRVGGYLVSFTDENRRDLYGEFFSSKTNFRLDDFPVEGHPVLFHHGLDETIKAHGIGVVDEVKIDNKGIWIAAKLKEHDEYTEWVKELLDEGILGWSSGALPQTVRVSDDGHIEEWAIVEASATHTPAEPFDTAITSIRSLSKTALRGRPQGAKEVTISTSANTVATVTIDFPDSAISHTTQTTQGENPTMNINKSKALKALDEEQRLEVVGIIEQMLNDYVGLMKEEARANEDYDEEAGRMADEEVEAVAAAKMEEELDGEDVKAANVRALTENKSFITAIAQAWLKAYNDARKARIETRRSLLADVMGDVQNAPGKSKKSEAGLKSGGNISVGEERKYAHMTPAQMALGYDMLTRHAIQNGIPAPIAAQNVSESYVKTMVNKLAKYAESEPFKARNGLESAQAQDWASNANNAIKSAIPYRANEVNASDLSGQGLEWVGEFWSNQIWEKARFETIYGKLLEKGMWEQELPKGVDTGYFPTEGADPIAYTSPESNDLTSDGFLSPASTLGFIGTGRVSITPKELNLATAYTLILDEDSVINMAAQTQRQLERKALEVIDQLMINGDTTATTNNNINLNDGTPGTGNATPYYIASDGFRHVPLVDNSAMAIDNLGAAVALADYRLTLGKFDDEVQTDLERLAFIINPGTHNSSLAISEIATNDVRRTNATIESGRLLNIFGVDVLNSGFLPKTTSAGTVSATPANNTLGSILAVYAPYWGVAWKRRMRLDTAFDIMSRSYVYVLSFRVGFVERGNTAAALTYNILLS